MASIRAKVRVLYLAITREAAMAHGFDYFEHLDDPEGVRKHLFPEGLIAWSIAEDILTVGDAA